MGTGRDLRWAAPALLVLSVAGATVAPVPDAAREGNTRSGDAGCVTCHAGIESMHPQGDLGCVACHGGNGAAATEAEAHVHPPATRSVDERVAPLDKDL